jgi:hypothetical protein
MAEPDVNEYDDEGRLVRSFTDVYRADSEDEADDLESTSSEDAECDSGLDADSDAELHDELEGIRRDYPSLPASDTPVIGGKRKQVPRNSLKKIEDNGADPASFRITETDKVSRTKCVLCNLVSTIRLMEVTATVAVAC